VIAIVAAAACSSHDPLPAPNPCVTVCQKFNSCRRPGDSLVSCDVCTYGGVLLPGLAPAPGCTAVETQEACVQAAVRKSCDEYDGAVIACATCPVVLDGSACASDADCQKYLPDYRCDLGRKGGYCTRMCGNADDCSPAGLETCTLSTAPSFDQGGTGKWCLLGCKSDAQCRTAEGYRCLRRQPSDEFGVCDVA
jgi:hypothetical protein